MKRTIVRKDTFVNASALMVAYDRGQRELAEKARVELDRPVCKPKPPVCMAMGVYGNPWNRR